MKCPACGFENPDEAGWCDFCKEPFRRAKAAPANGAHDVADFKDLDAGERIPTIPAWVRWFAWGFLGLWFLWGMILLGFYLGKQRVAEEERSLPSRAP
ncbi:MAG: hypothetical protein HY553_05975 [Elusimicrobia bacterium]|nr:hypothetical protein [Elusimicrobiota bacterium]